MSARLGLPKRLAAYHNPSMRNFCAPLQPVSIALKSSRILLAPRDGNNQTTDVGHVGASYASFHSVKPARRRKAADGDGEAGKSSTAPGCGRTTTKDDQDPAEFIRKAESIFSDASTTDPNAEETVFRHAQRERRPLNTSNVWNDDPDPDSEAGSSVGGVGKRSTGRINFDEADASTTPGSKDFKVRTDEEGNVIGGIELDDAQSGDGLRKMYSRLKQQEEGESDGGIVGEAAKVGKKDPRAAMWTTSMDDAGAQAGHDARRKDRDAEQFGGAAPTTAASSTATDNNETVADGEKLGDEQQKEETPTERRARLVREANEREALRRERRRNFNADGTPVEEEGTSTAADERKRSQHVWQQASFGFFSKVDFKKVDAEDREQLKVEQSDKELVDEGAHMLLQFSSVALGIIVYATHLYFTDPFEVGEFYRWRMTGTGKSTQEQVTS